MIKELNINNFKSIKELKFPCKKLNVFIGEPNSGKSNLIEALSLQSQDILKQELCREIFRYNTVSDLFFDFNINNPIEVITQNRHTQIKYGIREDGVIENNFHFHFNTFDEQDKPYVLTHKGEIQTHGSSAQTDVRFYNFKKITNFAISYLPHLSVPHGENLPSLLLSDSQLKKWVSEFLVANQLKLTLKPAENEIAVSKFKDEEIYSYPYLSLSETLQRIIFYTICIKTNQNSVILLDEPDSNTFPFYTKNLAEKIALDKSNQFFITTHNPYLLIGLIEKSKKEDINVCITEMKDFQTYLQILNDKQLTEVLDLSSDAFFNFDKLLS